MNLFGGAFALVFFSSVMVDESQSGNYIDLLDWIYLTSNYDGDIRYMYKVASQKNHVWIREEVLDDSSVKSSVILYRADCVSERIANIHATYYSSQNMRDIIYTGSNFGGWQYVAPDTVAESILREACLNK